MKVKAEGGHPRYGWTWTGSRYRGARTHALGAMNRAIRRTKRLREGIGGRAASARGIVEAGKTPQEG